MKNLHTFGCSLTASTKWPNALAQRCNYQINNHAVPAGDNMTQIRRFKNLILHKKINEDDFIIWEITYLLRLGFRLPPDHHFTTRNFNNTDITKNFHTHLPNIIDNQLHIDYVAFNKDWYDVNWYVQNINETLSELLYCFIIAKTIVKDNLVIWFAENNIFENEEQKKNFLVYLDDNGIRYLDYNNESLMSWVKKNNYELATDLLHPTEEIYNLYANTFLFPKIKL